MYKVLNYRQKKPRVTFITQVILLCQIIVISLGAFLLYQTITFNTLTYSRQDFSTIPKYQIDFNYIQKNNEISEAKLKKASALAVINEKNAPATLDKNYIIVDISEQIAYTFIDDNYVQKYTIASGDEKNPDRRAYPNVWKIAYYRTEGLTPLYGPCLLGLDVYKNGSWNSTLRALHGTDTPEILGTPKSLGCIYFHNDDILKICDLYQKGDIVVNIE